MTEKTLIEQMKREGAKLDVKQSPTYFQQCCGCIGKFNQTLKPVLLECGHFICQTNECLERRFCPQCHSSLRIRTNPYETLLSYLRLFDQPFENNQLKLYTFHINNKDFTYGQRISNVSENETIKNLIPESFLDEEEKKYDYQIVINSHSTLYSKVKDKTIKEYNLFIQQNYPNKQKLFFNRTNFHRTNTIRFIDRYNGANNS